MKGRSRTPASALLSGGKLPVCTDTDIPLPSSGGSFDGNRGANEQPKTFNMTSYIVIPKKDFDPENHKIIIGGLTRKLAIEAFERYNGREGSWKGKYRGQRDFKIVRMKLTNI